MNIFESDTFTHHGERATESAHRKIELQSPADLTYLIANVTRAAKELLDKHYPSPPPPAASPANADNDAEEESEEAQKRRRVEELVDDYIRDTFDKAKDSISINGMSAREMEAELAEAREGEEIEAFNPKLVQKIISLNKQIEHETLQLANLRRKAPRDTAQNFMSAFEKESVEYETLLRADEEARLAAARATNLDVGEVRRVDEMGSSWKRGKEDLEALSTGLGETVARMEKAQKAVEVVEGQR